MATFQKRQKEMKRLDKQREKAERRAQKKLIGRTETPVEALTPGEMEPFDPSKTEPAEPVPHN
ncbi:MAG: hypothetical protein ABSF71_02170 [Terriglobia bacterium]|jgi:hypothetical protein